MFLIHLCLWLCLFFMAIAMLSCMLIIHLCPLLCSHAFPFFVFFVGRVKPLFRGIIRSPYLHFLTVLTLCPSFLLILNSCVVHASLHAYIFTCFQLRFYYFFHMPLYANCLPFLLISSYAGAYTCALSVYTYAFTYVYYRSLSLISSVALAIHIHCLLQLL